MKYQSPPFKNFSWAKCGQLYGVNRELYTNLYGIKYHNGLDFGIPYGEPILATHNGMVVQVVYDSPDKTRGNGIYLLSDDNSFYTVYWHLSGFNIVIGQKVRAGDVIGYCGNSGRVFSVGKLVTFEEKIAGSRAGTHLHFSHRVLDLTKGIDGMIDPMPFLYTTGDRFTMFFGRNLFFGKIGNDVAWLQSVLKLEEFSEDYNPTGYFGLKTLRDVIRLQKKYNISPAFGFFGPITRTLIKKKYAFYV